jgi:hypothetical protein
VPKCRGHIFRSFPRISFLRGQTISHFRDEAAADEKAQDESDHEGQVRGVSGLNSPDVLTLRTVARVVLHAGSENPKV